MMSRGKCPGWVNEVGSSLRAHFGAGGEAVFVRAPGRVNLIGEHTDYNDGFVLPMALEQEVHLGARKRQDGMAKLWSESFAERAVFGLQGFDRSRSPGWARYPAGVLWSLEQEGIQLPGLEAVISGSLPVGAGLSSSAALEVAFALLITGLAGVDIPRRRLAQLCRRAENEFVGVQCGIMDQFVSLFGAQDCAVFLDCRSLDYELVPVDAQRASVVIIDSGIKHKLASTAYHQRQAECRQALGQLSRFVGVKKSLREVSNSQLQRFADKLPAKLLQRARHVVTENERVQQSVAALQAGKVEQFGKLMNASHNSLRYDYEVSCTELDLLVGFARETPGTLGVRLTGGGFGGAVVILSEPSRAHSLAEEVIARYRRATAIDAQVFFSRPAGGAEFIGRPAH